MLQPVSWSENIPHSCWTNLNLHLIFYWFSTCFISFDFICSWHFDYWLSPIWTWTGLHWTFSPGLSLKLLHQHYQPSASQNIVSCWAAASNISILTANCLIILYFTLRLLRIKSNILFILTSHQVNYFQSHQMCKYSGQDWVCCTNWNTQDKISASWFSSTNCSQSVDTWAGEYQIISC